MDSPRQAARLTGFNYSANLPTRGEFVMFAFIIAGLLAFSADAQVVRPPLPGFVVGNQQAAGGASILEQVPSGETVERWTRMVTTQRFEGLADRIDAAGFLNRLGALTTERCAGAKASEVRKPGTSAEIRIDCPLNPETGQPETFIARAIVHGHDLHVFQVAWRRVPTATDVAWGEHYLQGVAVKP